MTVLGNWTETTKRYRQDTLADLARGNDIPTIKRCIDLVSAGRYGVFASMGPNYRYAIFGRDSIEVAEHLLESHKTLVRNIIFTLARLQGVKNDPVSEEEPGKIHHEYRSQFFYGEQTSKTSITLMHKLQQWWGAIGTDELVYYGSFDATPMFIILVCKYAKLYGDDILQETYTDREGQSKTILDCLHAATHWLTAKIAASPWHLLEYKRINPSGIKNQVWKDSDTSYLHLDGAVANTNAGIASIELQAYAYDALMLMARHKEPKIAKQLETIAKQLQKATLKLLWMPKEQFFAQGLDHHNINGRPRQIKTLTSNVGLLLNSQILSNLSTRKRKMYVKAIVKTICGPEFMTTAGIRCRALRHKDMPGFADYHGTYAVWPKETFDIAQGLLQFGYTHLAQQLNDCILTSIPIAGNFYELFYVDDDNKAWLDHAASIKHFSLKYPFHHLSIPESGQAWAISAFLHIALNPRVATKKPSRFEKQILKNHLI